MNHEGRCNLLGRTTVSGRDEGAASAAGTRSRRRPVHASVCSARRHFQRVAGAASVLLLASLPLSARAACEVGSGGVYRVSLALPSSVTVPRDAPIGSVIASVRYTYSFNQSNPVGVYCTTGTTVENTSGSGKLSTNGVIPTEVNGIGYRLRLESDGYVPDTGSYQVPVSVFNTPSRCGYPASGRCFIYLGTPVVLELVKMGEVPANATVKGGLLFTQRLGGITASTVTLTTPEVRVAAQSCAVTTRDVSVKFGKVNMRELPEMNSVSREQALGITIDCRGVSSKLAVTFTDASNTSNRSNVLSLTSGSSAEGFGIQILSAGNPIRFGPDSPVAGNPNQVLIGEVNNTVYTAPFTARYIRTASAAKAGTANGAASFTVSYQ